MKKRLVLVVLLVLTLPLAQAQDDWFLESASATIAAEVSSSISLVPEARDASIRELTANLTLFPRNTYQQQVLSINPLPAEPGRESVLFSWKQPQESEVSFTLASKVAVTTALVDITGKIPFPLQETRGEEEYILPTEKIDSDSKEIIALASSLAEGEDDLSVIVFKLALWTRTNINYSLSTLTADITQKSSWVLANRRGVCDEITVLFIAFCRSLGIPARYVSGLAYTNSPEFTPGFGTHGWAEVYFPGFGWIPYDVTYGEFGYVDVGHIILKQSADAGDSSVGYSWTGRGYDVNPGKLSITAEVLEKKGSVLPWFTSSISPMDAKVSFGSYDYVAVSVENRYPSYRPAHVILSRTEKVDVLGPLDRTVLLKPYETRTLYYILHISDDLDRNYIYTLPISARILPGTVLETQIQASREETGYSLDYVSAGIPEELDEKSYVRTLSLACSQDNAEIYEHEPVKAQCTVKNTGNVMQKSVSVCADICNTLELGISQSRQVNFTIIRNDSGLHRIRVSAKGLDASATTFLNLTVFDLPKLQFSRLAYPSNVTFSQEFNISFDILKTSKTEPIGVHIYIEKPEFREQFELPSLDQDSSFVFELKGGYLAQGMNDFVIVAEFRDKEGRQYSEKQEFSIYLQRLTWWQSFIAWCNRLVFWMKEMVL